MRRLLVCFAWLLIPAATLAADPFLLKPGQRIVFLGDSNTFAGRFIMVIDAFLVTRFPEQHFELINLGLPSETVTGLSEPDHPYPRPNVHDRLERALQKTKPDVVIICYGMNDGMYYPFSGERFRKYQAGIRALLKKCRDAGAKVVVHTPAPFDRLPLRSKVLPATAEKFSWLRPFEDYDGVLTRYSEWLLTLRREGVPVADPHTAILDFLKLRRQTEPTFRVSGDGIHPDGTGQWFIARELLRALHAPATDGTLDINLAAARQPNEVRERLRVTHDTIEYRWHGMVPMAQDPTWDAKMLELEKITQTWNGSVFRLRGAAAARYDLFEGNRKLTAVTGEQLASGIDLTRLPEFSLNKRRAEIWKLVEKRQRLLGLAWLTDVGHQRPDTPKGIPIAAARKQGLEIDAQIQELAKPTEIMLKFVPAK